MPSAIQPGPCRHSKYKEMPIMRISRFRLVALSPLSAAVPLLLAGAATASQASTPPVQACSQPPFVAVDQSDA